MRPWPQSNMAWTGHVNRVPGWDHEFVVWSPKWPYMPPEGTQVRVQVIYRSPYRALVDEE